MFLKEILILKEYHISGNTDVISHDIITYITMNYIPDKHIEQIVQQAYDVQEMVDGQSTHSQMGIKPDNLDVNQIVDNRGTQILELQMENN